MKLFIKNMVCPRCIMVIQRALDELHITAKSVELGVVALEKPLSELQMEQLTTHLEALGFEILNDPKHRQVEEIKSWLIKVLREEKLAPHFSVKKYLSANICKEYSYLSKLFSEKEGITIEQYFILLKLEKVKEFLSYGELSLGEIAWTLGYSSVQHLSSQFKKAFGISAREFKGALVFKRKAIDQVGI